MSNSTELRSKYDVVIVGGRPAGASLAARLGTHGVSVLVVERATMPSMPAVPSCAILYPHTMAALVELGLSEEEFCDPTAKSDRFYIEVDGHFESPFDMIEAHGRRFICGLDRDVFDHVLWRNLERYPSVTALEQTSFIDVRRDAHDEIDGVVIKGPDGKTQEIGAGCAVGADGRFSGFARKVGATMRESFPRSSTVHFATWQDVAPHRTAGDGPTMCVYTTARGLAVLFFPAPGGRVNVVTHMRTDRMRSEGSIDDFYQRTIRSLGTPRRRLEGAKQVTSVLGLKRVANGYREAGGPGWVLVGDALHHKDPIDGQGIYDALVETKILDEELRGWLRGEQELAQAVASYEQRVMAETHDMYEATTQRIDRELYEEPPALVIKTLMRWLLTDDSYKRRFLEYLCRTTPPKTWLTSSLMAGAVARGIGGDLRRLLPPWGRQAS